MKILQVISSFPPAYAYGGPVKSAYKLSQALVNRGHDVTVFTTDVKDENSRVDIDENPTTIDGIEVYRFRNLSNSLAWRLRITTAIGIGRGLHERLTDFDVVHLHEYRSFEAYLTYWYATKNDVPYVLQPRGSLPRRSRTLQKRLFDTVFGKPILQEADALIASSQTESSQYKEFVPGSELSVEHVPNGIDLDDFQLFPDAGTFRTKYSIEQDTSLVLFLSRLHKRKGADLLVSAFDEVRDLWEDTLLVLVGPDEGHRSGLERQVHDAGLEKNVLFTGPLYGDDKLAAYRDADVFVLPSKDRYESFGNVVLEALACGTPTVVTEVCGVAEYVPERFSTVVEPTKSAIAQGIGDILRDSSVNSDLMTSFLKSELSWAAVAERTESVYRSLPKLESDG